MKNDFSQTIFYLGLKHIHKYVSAKFQPNPLFSSQQMATEHAESVAEEKQKPKKNKQTKKKNSRQTHRGSRRDEMPQLQGQAHIDSCQKTFTRKKKSHDLISYLL